MSAISNTFDQRIADGLGDLLTGATGIRTSNIPEISAEVMQGKSKNREARAKVLNDAMGGRAGDNPAAGVKLQFPENFVTERGIPSTVVENEDGTTTVIKSGPKFEILAENDLESYTLSTPAISDGQIFIRTEDHLYCIGKRGFTGD